MNKTSIIRTAIVSAAIVACTTAISYRPRPQYDPIAQRLAVCGDTPSPYEDWNHIRIEIPRDRYERMTQSVDDCRKMLLEHPEG